MPAEVVSDLSASHPSGACAKSAQEFVRYWLDRKDLTQHIDVRWCVVEKRIFIPFKSGLISGMLDFLQNFKNAFHVILGEKVLDIFRQRLSVTALIFQLLKVFLQFGYLV